MADIVTQLAADIRVVDGDHKKGAEQIAEGLVMRGWTKREYIVRFPTDYVVGTRVEILDPQSYNWVPGEVSGQVAGTIQVDTERGPRTVGSASRIRKQV